MIIGRQAEQSRRSFGWRNPMRRLWRRVYFLLNRRRLERELAEEMETHRDMMPADRRSEFGRAARLREEAREAWSWRWLEEFCQDLSYGANRRIAWIAPLAC